MWGMTLLQIQDCVTELARQADPTPGVTAATVAMRRCRAEQLDEIHTVVQTGEYLADGYRSPAAWLSTTTCEGFGQCKITLRLAERIQHMSLIRTAFGTGTLAETALRLLVDAWAPDIADHFDRDEPMLLGWATTLPARDLKMVLDTWRMHTNPDREQQTTQQRFDNRCLHMSRLLDGVGRLDGTLTAESYQLVHEAIRALSQPADDETRTPAQRRHDALVQMATITLNTFNAPIVQNRRRPKVIATATITDLAASTGGGSIDTGGERTVVPIDTVRRMACDCELHRYLTEPSGHIIDYGRSKRLISNTQFDLLVIRDHGCRWPGCAIPAAGCDAHHADHWLDNGETEPDNLILLCWYHHHLLHEQHWRIKPHRGGHFTLHTPNGQQHPIRPPLVGTGLVNGP
jgi:Domain of unknown function (DUF222)